MVRVELLLTMVLTPRVVPDWRPGGYGRAGRYSASSLGGPLLHRDRLPQLDVHGASGRRQERRGVGVTNLPDPSRFQKLIYFMTLSRRVS